MNVLNEPYVRIVAGKKYCSGVFISPDFQPSEGSSRLVLTCAHFFRDLPAVPRVAARGGTIAAVRQIDGTDMALVLLSRPGPRTRLPGLASVPPQLGAPLLTHGFGGGAKKVQTRSGVLVMPVPFAIARRTYTRLRHALIAFSPAIKGDSGAAVEHNGAVVGIQSLVFDPLGTNLHIATIARVDKYLPALRAAARALLAD
ncbi:hypothetical protein CPHO_06125 [Corynebacterium phocae]|uniref:Peptidase S1 domain-containing protein n=1 Tax=Corynebacterium phocae TaxID=161895 RepID=A0A1L7D333_9CORY|nr:serine protease [Corynebacterium phocae]APT92534.1 hypothetical protein CPHO_06125 [Corynebacterium phocae]KAA8725137.1 trypsin-like peptidase domain-containing protein [Corynebacterium phocae]